MSKLQYSIFRPFVRSSTTYPQDDVPKDKWKHRSDNTHDKSMRTTDQHRNTPNAWQQVPSETTRNEQSAHKNKNRLRISSQLSLTTTPTRRDIRFRTILGKIAESRNKIYSATKQGLYRDAYSVAHWH